MSMKFSEVLFWYNRCEFQSTEEEVINELSTDKNGKEKKLPNALIIREIVLHKIKHRKQKFKKLQENPEGLQKELEIVRESLKKEYGT